MHGQSVWFDAPYQVSVRAEPMPILADDQVLVATIVSAISAGTELLFYRGLIPPDMQIDAAIPGLDGAMRYPLTYGYACVGRVVQKGNQVSDEWRDRIVFAFHPHASHFVARIDELVPVPQGISPEHAAFLPNVESAVNFVMDGAPLIGERVIVLGQGILGLLTIALLAQMPLAELCAFDKFSLRRDKSRALGVSEVVDPTDAAAMERVRARLSDGADLVYELTGTPDALNLAIDLTGFSGRIVVGSWYGQKRAPIDFGGKFHRSRLRIISSQVSTVAPELQGRWTKSRRLQVAWEMLARLPLGDLVTHRFPIADAARAYKLLDQQPDQAIQVMIRYD
ncbi:MAG: zinc-binding alcohol dehydrogenase [Chloroflexi bacterium]|nr:zinc-binding alcohol dehydrogenase [Chloroflexota bacterium]